MIVEASNRDFALLMQGQVPETLLLGVDTVLAPLPVLEVLATLAASISAQFTPSAWMLVEGHEIVGLMSITRLPGPGEIHIGYGVAPIQQRRGAATRALAELVNWARQDDRVSRITAETGLDNIASQRVLERNGFVRIGGRIDDDDGPLICWGIATD